MKRRKVGLVLRDESNTTLDALSVVTGRGKSDLVEAAIDVAKAGLPKAQRDAVDAVVLSAREHAAS